MKNDLSKLSQAGRPEPFRVRAGFMCRECNRGEQETRGHGILPPNPSEVRPSEETESSAARTIQVAGYWLLFLAAAVTLGGSVTLIITFCLAGKPVCLFLALCLAVLSAIIITQF